MKVVLGERLDEALGKALPAIQRAFWKQISLLEKDIRHPSLHAKKYDESADIWQARINKNWRFYFIIEKETIILIKIQKHPK